MSLNMMTQSSFGIAKTKSKVYGSNMKIQPSNDCMVGLSHEAVMEHNNLMTAN